MEELKFEIVEAAEGGVTMGQLSDGEHTFDELYTFRMVYNANLFKSWIDRKDISLYRSKKHDDGEYCFGADGEWFVVVAETPAGQISNHYQTEYWNLFDFMPTVETAPKWDGHSSADVVDRLITLINM